MSLKLDDSDGSTVSGVDPDVTLDNTLDNSRSNYSSTNNNSDGAQQSQTITRDDQHRQQQQSRRELNRISKLKCQKRKLDLVNSLRAEVSRLTTIHNALRTENQQLRRELFLACCNALEHKNNANQHLFCNQNEQLVQQELVQGRNAPMQGSLAQTNQIEAFLSRLLANPSMIATSALHHILREVGPQSVAQEGFVMLSQPSSAAHHSLNDDDAGIESAHIRPSIMTVPWSGAQERNVARLPSSSSIDRDMGKESSQHMLSFTMAFPWSDIQENNAASLPSNVGAHDLYLDGNGIKSLLDDDDDDEQPDLTFRPKGSRRG